MAPSRNITMTQKEKEIFALIGNAEFYGDLSVHGNSYPLPAGREWELEGELRVILSDIDFLRKYRTTIGMQHLPKRSEFDRNGMYNDVFAITVSYLFITHDGGKVVWDFQGAEDAYGNCDILKETPQSHLLYDLFKKSTVDIENMYFYVTGKRTY